MYKFVLIKHLQNLFNLLLHLKNTNHEKKSTPFFNNFTFVDIQR